ncbi:MAG: hypothetical protein Fur009_4470 [Candidatus Microgenomates bacterium]
MNEPQVSSLMSRLLELSKNLDNTTVPKEILTSYFGPEISNFKGILPDDESKNKATSILKGFYSLAFDKGLRRNTILKISSIEQTEKPVFLLSRSAWIDQVEKKAGENFTNLQGVLFLDVASLNYANKAVENSNIGGDFLLQRVARLLNQALESIDEETKNSFDFITCRYGGDEFAVAVIRKSEIQNHQIDLNEVLAKIKTKISSGKAYYKRQGKDSSKEENIQLKEEETKAIKTPGGELDRLIFITALQKGLVVDEKEIALIKTIFGIDDSGNDEDKINKINEYFKQYQIKEPNYETEALFIMHDLAQKQLEFAPSLYLANLLDQKDEEINGKKPDFQKNKRLISLLRFIKRGLNDRLLGGERVLGFEDFLEHIKRGDFSQVIGIEMKFVKELNDHFSMVIADDVIRQLFNHLKTGIGDEVASQLYFYRRGGSFFIGVKRGVNLNEEYIDKLKQAATSFSVSEVLSNKLSSPLQILLGLAIWQDPRFEDLNRFMEDLDKDWYQKVPEDIRNEIKKRSIELPQKPERLDKIFSQLTLENLYRLFFGSEKRGEERRKRA